MIKKLNINEDVTNKDIKAVMKAALKAKTTSDVPPILRSLRDIDNTKYKYFNKRWNSGIITASELGQEIYDNLSDTINANKSINKEFSKKTINEGVTDEIRIAKNDLSDIRTRLHEIEDELEWFDVEVDDILSNEIDVSDDYAIALAELIGDIRSRLNQTKRYMKQEINKLPD